MIFQANRSLVVRHCKEVVTASHQLSDLYSAAVKTEQQRNDNLPLTDDRLGLPLQCNTSTKLALM